MLVMNILLFIFGCSRSVVLCVGFPWSQRVAATLQLRCAASLVVGSGLQGAGLVAVAHGLGCPEAYGIFPGQGLNPCPLYQQADFSTTKPPGKSCH